MMRWPTLISLLLLAISGTAAATDNSVAETRWRDFSSLSAKPAPAMQFPHQSCFSAAAAEYQLPLSLLLAVARGESDFDATARSKANAHGVMQIQWPGTAKHLGIHRLSDLYDPCKNIDAGARYLVELTNRYNGDLYRALAAYNYGPGRIDANSAIPRGADWYSGYIYNHLEYVTGGRNNQELLSGRLYSELGRSKLISFGEPYRAAAFVDRLRNRAPTLQLDWFRRDVGRFDVVLVYDNKEEFDASTALLAGSGFVIDGT